MGSCAPKDFQLVLFTEIRAKGSEKIPCVVLRMVVLLSWLLLTLLVEVWISLMSHRLSILIYLLTLMIMFIVLAVQDALETLVMRFPISMRGTRVLFVSCMN